MKSYYRNSFTGEVRIVQPLADDYFVVVKMISDDMRSVKIWRGELNSVASRWKTIPFNPTSCEKAVWDSIFSKATQEALSVLLSLD